MSSNQKRFSKKIILEYLDERALYYEKKYGFNSSNGWAQVDGRGEEINRAYGEFAALNQLWDNLDGNRL